MKRTLLISFIITGVCFGQTHEFAEEFYKNGIPKVTNTYKESRGKLEFVKQVSWYDNGQKKEEETYKDGKEDGKWTQWYGNGQKSIERTYKNGEVDGEWTQWHGNGQKSVEGTYKDGKVNGEWIRWGDDGSLTFKLTLQDENAFKSVFIIDGRFNCFDGSKSVQASWINDNECDCSDCSDEPLMKR